MASIAGTVNGAQQIPLAERADVHKSCKSLELLVQAFSEYAEAAAGIVALQRKLAKALKETAALRVTGEIACMCFRSHTHSPLSRETGNNERLK
jgi:hypothetical protein